MLGLKANRWVGTVAVLTTAWMAQLANAQEAVKFRSLDRWDNAALTVDGYVFKPASGKAPHRMVVVLHGCDGAVDTQGGLTKHMRDTAQRLTQMGYAALVVDSWTARKLPSQCAVTPEQATVTYENLWKDAFGALRFVQSKPQEFSDRVGLLGFYSGGTAAIESMDKTVSPIEDGTSQGFAGAVAFYPDCSDLIGLNDDFVTYGQALILGAGLDEWSPVQTCRSLARKSIASQDVVPDDDGTDDGVTVNGNRNDLERPVEVHVYKKAHHGFDRDEPVREWAEVLRDNSPVKAGGSPADRDDAYKRIGEFFNMMLNDGAEQDPSMLRNKKPQTKPSTKKQTKLN